MRDGNPYRPVKKYQLVVFLSLILGTGFLVTSLVSYFVSRSSLRAQIDATALPLTSDNIYSEIQRDLLRPVFISSLMANDTFLRDWVLAGEQDADKMTRYLREIQSKYGTFTSFFVSEATRIYYHSDGILKKVKPEEERDRWYFRVRQMDLDYEINVDPDLANRDELTIFINHKVQDYQGRYIGATGVGLTIKAVVALMQEYNRKYGVNVYFVNSAGRIVLQSGQSDGGARNIRDLPGISVVADAVLAGKTHVFKYRREGQLAHLHSRHVPELGWLLLVEQAEGPALGGITRALVVNLLFCAIITSLVVTLTGLAIGTYQRVTRQQQDELLQKHAKLEAALAEVRKLSGLLPVCSACKKVRDDKGYWQQFEVYLREHSDAEISHGICPECARRHYPDYFEEADAKEGG